MKTALLLCTFNRAEYLKRTLTSLSKADLTNVDVLVVDDNSTDRETRQLIFDAPYEKLISPINGSIKHSLLIGFNLLFSRGYFAVINLDSDTLVRPDFVHRLLLLHGRFPDRIITGFNCRTKNRNGTERHVITDEGEGYNVKQSVGGVNMLVTRGMYDKYVRPALVKTLTENGNWDYHATKDTPGVICAVPSVIQHIGLESSMGHTNSEPADVADDFKLLSLPDVTLLGVDGANSDRLHKAITHCTKDIDFGVVVCLTDIPLKSKEEYSEWIFRHTHEHVQTSHVLICQHDGYVMNASSWNKEWLQYDYIGAPWWYRDGMDVGNGGFSLRSRRLMEAVSKMQPKTTHPEDHVICRVLRPELERMGFKFAPGEVAERFSVEGYNQPGAKYTDQFGFHGNIIHKKEPKPGRSKKLCVLQPFGLGDVIFCQTLMRHFAEYDITWPVKDCFVDDLNRAYPDINFVSERASPVPLNLQVDGTRAGWRVVPIRWSNHIKRVPYSQVMRAKYDMYRQDWTKWKDGAMWIRDREREYALELELNLPEQYTVVNRTFGCSFEGKADIPVEGVELRQIPGYSLFDWVRVLKGAKEIHTVSTSLLYILALIETGPVYVYIRRPNEQNHENYRYIFTDPKFIYVE